MTHVEESLLPLAPLLKDCLRKDQIISLINVAQDGKILTQG